MCDVAEIESIEDAQSFLKNTYPNGAITEDYIYGYLSRYTGYLCKAVWQETIKDRDFFRTVSWLMALCSKLGISLESAFIHRFPSVCPYCIHSPCACRDTKKAPVSYVPPYKVVEELHAKAEVIKNTGQCVDFDMAVKIIATLYPNNGIIWDYGGPWRHLVKIQEEVAEIHEAMSGVLNERLPKRLLEEEVADAFAWILSAWDILYRDRSFRDEFITYYMDGCPVCRASPCACAVRSERSSIFVTDEVIEQIQNQLMELRGLIDNETTDFDEVSRSLAAAARDKSEPVSVGALKQTKDAIEKVEASIDFADKNSKKVVGIIGAISKIIETIGG